MVMPQPNDRVRGGHAVTGVGYDDFKQCFIVRWGEGCKGRRGNTCIYSVWLRKDWVMYIMQTCR